MKESKHPRKKRAKKHDEDVSGTSKRISIQEARKYFRKKNHNTSAITFWDSEL